MHFLIKNSFYFVKYLAPLIVTLGAPQMFSNERDRIKTGVVFGTKIFKQDFERSSQFRNTPFPWPVFLLCLFLLDFEKGLKLELCWPSLDQGWTCEELLLLV